MLFLLPRRLAFFLLLSLESGLWRLWIVSAHGLVRLRCSLSDSATAPFTIAAWRIQGARIIERLVSISLRWIVNRAAASCTWSTALTSHVTLIWIASKAHHLARARRVLLFLTFPSKVASSRAKALRDDWTCSCNETSEAWCRQIKDSASFLTLIIPTVTLRTDTISRNARIGLAIISTTSTARIKLISVLSCLLPFNLQTLRRWEQILNQDYLLSNRISSFNPILHVGEWLQRINAEHVVPQILLDSWRTIFQKILHAR